jgi:hypothetical protein
MSGFERQGVVDVWKSALMGVARRLLMLAALVILFVIIQPLVKRAPWVHAVIVIFVRTFVLGRLL